MVRRKRTTKGSIGKKKVYNMKNCRVTFIKKK
jgi:hypothetical protein